MDLWCRLSIHKQLFRGNEFICWPVGDKSLEEKRQKEEGNLSRGLQAFTAAGVEGWVRVALRELPKAKKSNEF